MKSRLMPALEIFRCCKCHRFTEGGCCRDDNAWMNIVMFFFFPILVAICGIDEDHPLPEWLILRTGKVSVEAWGCGNVTPVVNSWGTG